MRHATNDTCMFYVHHVEHITHERLQFSGKGKHPKRIKFENADDVLEPDITWLLQHVNDNAPY